jgi:hypothetical protein
MMGFKTWMNGNKKDLWKGKFQPTADHKDGEWSCSSTLSLTSALDWVGGQGPAPTDLAPGETR